MKPSRTDSHQVRQRLQPQSRDLIRNRIQVRLTGFRSAPSRHRIAECQFLAYPNTLTRLCKNTQYELLISVKGAV
ncbi:MAG: hypothetical protein KIT54_04565 [Phycisphaeraceae bacterium]|nr:hypothetical protein [Phycisphaeraceae bacterium]